MHSVIDEEARNIPQTRPNDSQSWLVQFCSVLMKVKGPYLLKGYTYASEVKKILLL
ncbi:hypothetical protein JCM19239_6083 [Vibrio variabilis]|uniref:Uncharacterized protein n=1 Tax=Vibrio variabilis TaxID=990271 RepID=A0ABQ0JJT3_9VIBR|nr:hypothetical protein JCM19239_6083 [Vibrio variabilis]